MAISNQHKITILILGLYWPVLIIAAHIPVPQSVRSANVSDKSLHFLAYLVLTFLVWFSIRPNTKVNWGKATVWLVLLALTGYGAVDEVVQSYVGRNCDAMDIAANFAGILFGLFLATFLTFRPTFLIITGVIIFGITNVAKKNLDDIFPVLYAMFHLCAYAVFTILWLLNINRYFSEKPPEPRWLIQAAAVPVCFLLTVKIFSIFLGRDISTRDIVISVISIIMVVSICFLGALFLKRRIKGVPNQD